MYCAVIDCSRVQRTCSVVVRVFESFGAFGPPTAFPCGHRCTVGIDRDSPMCLDAHGGIKAKRQPFVVGSREVMWSWTWSGRCVVVNILSTVGTENTYMIGEFRQTRPSRNSAGKLSILCGEADRRTCVEGAQFSGKKILRWNQNWADHRNKAFPQ